jgi:hypothetical protein
MQRAAGLAWQPQSHSGISSPHLLGESCSSKPNALHAVCTWVARYQPAPPPIDLTALLQERPARGLREVVERSLTPSEIGQVVFCRH